MKIIAMISLVLSVFANNFFIGPNQSYSILLLPDMQLAQTDTIKTDNQMITHTFIGTDSIEKFDYTLGISVIENKAESLLDPLTIKNYEKDCECTITSSEAVEFNNFSGVKYIMIKEFESTTFEGQVYISEYKNGKSINVVSLAIAKSESYLTANLEPILNSLVLNF